MSAALRPLCFVLLLLCGTRPLHAQDDPIARGVELRRQGKNAEALAEFERAYAENPTPRALAQIALAQQALGNWVAAESGLVAALGAREDPWIQRFASTLEAALVTVRDHLASLYVDSDTPGASIFVAGHPAGTVPLSAAIRVPSGDTWVELRAAGYASQSQALHLPARSERRITVHLSKLPQLALAASVAPAVRHDAQLPPAPVAPAPPPPSHAQRTAGIVALVAGGVLLAGGVTAHAMWQYNVRKANDPSFCDEQYDCSAYEARANTARTLTIIGYSAAGAAALTGILLLITAPHGDRFPAQLGLSASGASLELHTAW